MREPAPVTASEASWPGSAADEDLDDSIEIHGGRVRGRPVKPADAPLVTRDLSVICSQSRRTVGLTTGRQPLSQPRTIGQLRCRDSPRARAALVSHLQREQAALLFTVYV